MIHDGRPIGVIGVSRGTPGAFSDRQIQLLRTFADHAVIAIENTRLFEAEQARTRELQESLEYQTATAEVLSVISRAPQQVRPVFDSIVTTAERLCRADFAFVYGRRDDGDFHLVVANNASSEYIKYRSQTPVRLGDSSIMGRAIASRCVIHVPDVLADGTQEYTQAHRLGRIRSALAVPLLRQGDPIGVIGVVRTESRPFSDRQIALMTTFADQAVIAIENTRLFEAEQARTRELSESLEQQTATSEVLEVISSSPGELEPVFRATLENATRLCEVSFGNLLL